MNSRSSSTTTTATTLSIRSSSSNNSPTNSKMRLNISKSTPINDSTAMKSVGGLHIGDRVQVNAHQGIIRFIGPTQFKAGTWVGIELDLIGQGKNDGSIEGKRYFVCPPNTGLFILAIKVIKQQQHLLLQNRPSTPHHQPHHINNKSSPPPPLPTTVTKPITKEVKNDEMITLRKKLIELESENRILKKENKRIQTTVTEIKKASMDSMEILESLILQHQDKIHSLENKLDQKRAIIDELKRAGMEAIDSYESSLAQVQKRHFHEIQLLLKDIDILEIVLQNKMSQNNDLSKREKKLSIEIKRYQHHHSFTRLDTPIQEVDEEHEYCPLCNQLGHDLIHCTTLVS